MEDKTTADLFFYFKDNFLTCDEDVLSLYHVFQHQLFPGQIQLPEVPPDITEDITDDRIKLCYQLLLLLKINPKSIFLYVWTPIKKKFNENNKLLPWMHSIRTDVELVVPTYLDKDINFLFNLPSNHSIEHFQSLCYTMLDPYNSENNPFSKWNQSPNDTFLIGAAFYLRDDENVSYRRFMRNRILEAIHEDSINLVLLFHHHMPWFDVNREIFFDEAPLERACRQGATQVAKYLLDQGAVPIFENISDNPISHALQMQDPQLAAMMHRNGATMGDYMKDLNIEQAIITNNIPDLQFYYTNLMAPKKWKHLRWAIREERDEITQSLLDSMDVNKKNWEGKNLLMMIIDEIDLEVQGPYKNKLFQSVIEKTNNLELVNHDGETAVQMLERSRHGDNFKCRINQEIENRY